jgi:hypothetical protein
MRLLDIARGRYALAALAYALITAAIFHNLLPVISTRIYSDIGDPLLNASILAWNASHVPLTTAWWNYPSFCAGSKNRTAPSGSRRLPRGGSIVCRASKTIHSCLYRWDCRHLGVRFTSHSGSARVRMLESKRHRVLPLRQHN